MFYYFTHYLANAMMVPLNRSRWRASSVVDASVKQRCLSSASRGEMIWGEIWKEVFAPYFKILRKSLNLYLLTDDAQFPFHVTV